MFNVFFMFYAESLVLQWYVLAEYAYTLAANNCAIDTDNFTIWAKNDVNNFELKMQKRLLIQIIQQLMQL